MKLNNGLKDYIAYPITISSPDVLKRLDSDYGQSFEFQSIENSFYVSLVTKTINKDEDPQNIVLNYLKEKGALNILTQQEEFLLDFWNKHLKNLDL